MPESVAVRREPAIRSENRSLMTMSRFASLVLNAHAIKRARLHLQSGLLAIVNRAGISKCERFQPRTPEISRFARPLRCERQRRVLSEGAKVYERHSRRAEFVVRHGGATARGRLVGASGTSPSLAFEQYRMMRQVFAIRCTRTVGVMTWRHPRRIPGSVI